ncbi:MAG: 16S rRNA (cytosine(1402)-N(4))-methyltransferase RsmH [Planctomycetota bacterium]|jgi:16S rRNA (cytosine1402-N4)-methyltransferase
MDYVINPSDPSGHIPVLLDQVVELLAPKPGAVILDCTLGRGGHAEQIIKRIQPGGVYVGLDLDGVNIAHAKERLADAGDALRVVHSNFAQARQALDALGIDRVDGLLADLGFSSNQVDDAERGLSFQQDGPLDMRLNTSGGQTAEDLVNTLSEGELARVIGDYGEDRLAQKIARKIVEIRGGRPIKSTGQLSDLCASVYRAARCKDRIDPATRTFQALRIAVNDELGSLESLLAGLPELMRPGGRSAIISFHSLEDRLVKDAFKRWVRANRAVAVTKKPAVASEAERAVNPRSRSAKCRVIEWVNGLA